jgi:tRNA (guanine37-N1)-methyltransferase
MKEKSKVVTGEKPREKIWRVKVLTLFSEMFPGPLAYSLAGRGLEDGLWSLETVDIRDFASDKHRTVDGAPYGGGAGMVMRPDVTAAALAAQKKDAADLAPIFLSPRGRRLDQKRVRELALGPGMVLLCGRYEGVDQRAIEAGGVEEISLGDFVLSGGEPAAIALIDACLRLRPGIMGGRESLAEESFDEGLLEYPHYTRPRTWDGRQVPEVLVSGDHEKVRRWRAEQAQAITRQRRPDLWQTWAGRKA